MIIYVRTKIQMLLLEKELKSQLSDGYWENTTTDKALWRAKVYLAPESSEVIGKLDYPVDFTDLMDEEHLVERMLEIAQEVDRGYTADNLRDDLEELTELLYGK